MRQFFTDVIEATGQPADARVVPYWFGVLLARMMGLVFAVFRPGTQPPLTLETVRLIGSRLELSNALAKRELGYAPTVSPSAGISRMRSAAAIPSVGARRSAGASAAVFKVVLLALAIAGTTPAVRTFTA